MSDPEQSDQRLTDREEIESQRLEVRESISGNSLTALKQIRGEIKAQLAIMDAGFDEAGFVMQEIFDGQQEFQFNLRRMILEEVETEIDGR